MTGELDTTLIELIDAAARWGLPAAAELVGLNEEKARAYLRRVKEGQDGEARGSDRHGAPAAGDA